MSSLLPFGRFEFTWGQNLGIGGLGRVDQIKIVASNSPENPVGSFRACKRLNAQWDNNPTIHQRFEREIAAVRSMSHLGIVTCSGENLTGGRRFYVMPLYSSTLRQLVASNRYAGNWREVAGLGATLADALDYAHGLGFIDRDLKPDNVLFNSGGPLVIADWGLGYFVHKESKVLQHLTRGGMGTEYYCSLEQWNTGKCAANGDIYSLGMTLDEFVTGAQRQIVVGMGVRSNSVTPSTAGAQNFNALIQKMTHPVPSMRSTNMAEVARELRALSVLA